MSNELAQKTNTVLMLQVVMTVLVAAAFYIYRDAWFAYSAIYGGLISVLLVILLSRGFNRASSSDSKAGEIALYLGAAIRFVMVLMLFGLGMAVLKLEAMAIVITFGLTQLAFALANARTGKHADNRSE